MFDFIKTAAIRSQIAQINSGKLLNYENGDWPTGLICRDNIWEADDPKRPYFRWHDPINWDIAQNSKELLTLMEQKQLQNIQNNMQGTEFAHWGNKPGFIGRERSGRLEHWCHAVNFRTLDRSRWLKWLEIAKSAIGKTWTLARDLHTFYYQLYVAWINGDVDWVKPELERLTNLILSVPLKNQGEPLYHKLFPIALYEFAEKKAYDWLLQAVKDFQNADFPLILAAIAYNITDEPGYLEDQLPELYNWAKKCYREIGSVIDYYSLPQYNPISQVKIFLDACEKAALTLIEQPSFSGLPISQVNFNSITIEGEDLRNGIIKWVSFGGDACDIVLTPIAPAIGTAIHLPNNPENSKGQASYSFPDKVTQLHIHPSWFANISIDPGCKFSVKLKAGEEYYIGNSNGILKGGGRLKIEVPQREEDRNYWLNFKYGGDQFKGMYAGYNKFGYNPRIVIIPGQQKFELIGQDYGFAKLLPMVNLLFFPDI